MMSQIIFWRIFDVYNVEDGEDYNIVDGYCAWSIETCCRASGYSNGTDLLSVNTKDLNLVVEVWSREPAIGFEEHYIYDNGRCHANECESMEEWYWDRECSFEEYCEEYDVPEGTTEDDFDDEGNYRQGGFENFGDWFI